MDFNFSQFEVNLRNYYFVLTFVTTIYYWVKIIFLSKSQSIKLGYAGIVILNLTLTLQLILRWINSGHFPLSGLYESLLFLTWGVSFIYLFIEKFMVVMNKYVEQPLNKLYQHLLMLNLIGSVMNYLQYQINLYDHYLIYQLVQHVNLTFHAYYDQYQSLYGTYDLQE